MFLLFNLLPSILFISAGIWLFIRNIKIYKFRIITTDLLFKYFRYELQKTSELLRERIKENISSEKEIDDFYASCKNRCDYLLKLYEDISYFDLIFTFKPLTFETWYPVDFCNAIKFIKRYMYIDKEKTEFLKENNKGVKDNV